MSKKKGGEHEGGERHGEIVIKCRAEGKGFNQCRSHRHKEESQDHVWSCFNFNVLQPREVVHISVAKDTNFWACVCVCRGMNEYGCVWINYNREARKAASAMPKLPANVLLLLYGSLDPPNRLPAISATPDSIPKKCIFKSPFNAYTQIL